MAAWSCPHCAKPEELHLHFGVDPATGADRVVCLFDRWGMVLADRYADLLEIVRGAYRVAKGVPTHLFVARRELEAVQEAKRAFELSAAERLEELEREAAEIAAAHEKYAAGEGERLRERRERIEALHQEDLRRRLSPLQHRITALEAELAEARKHGATAEAMQSLEARIGELQTEIAKLREEIAGLRDENVRLAETINTLWHDDKLQAYIRRVTAEHKEKILSSSDSGQRKALERRVLALEAEKAELERRAATCDELIGLNRELERRKTELEDRVAELQAELDDARGAAPTPVAAPATTDFGTCLSCGAQATQGLVSHVGTFGACDNAEHLKKAVAEHALKSSKKPRVTLPGKKPGATA